MVETLQGLSVGSVKPRPQDHSQATLAPILQKEDGRMNFTLTAQELLNRLRGFQPWPGAFTSFHGKSLNVWQAVVGDMNASSGEMIVTSDRLIAGCGNQTSLELLEVQPEGKKRMPAKAFIQGYRPMSGEKLGA